MKLLSRSAISFRQTMKKEPKKIPDGETRKSWVINAKSSNKWLTISEIAYLCGVSSKTVESWLYETNKHPPMFAVFALGQSIFNAYGNIDREMNNCINMFNQRWYKCSKYATGDKINRVGDKKTTTYLYSGEKLRQSELARKLKMSDSGIFHRLKVINPQPNQDLTEILNNWPKRGRKKRSIPMSDESKNHADLRRINHPPLSGC